MRKGEDGGLEDWMIGGCEVYGPWDLSLGEIRYWYVYVLVDRG